MALIESLLAYRDKLQADGKFIEACAVTYCIRLARRYTGGL